MTAFRQPPTPPPASAKPRVPVPKPRALRGDATTPPVSIGIAGLGRSGWNIHADTLAALPQRFTVVAVADGQATRREEATQRFGCEAYADVDAMLADPKLEAVVIATPNTLHAAHAISAFEHGLHVVAEKPMAMDLSEADAMIGAASRAGRLLAPFQNRRFEAGFLKVREIIDSGQLGRVVQVRMCWHQFTRRWDWQVVRDQGGGLLRVNGTHLIDQAMQFLGDGPVEVFADLQRALSCGDAEDHVKVLLRGDGPTIDIELSNANAWPQDRWLIMGTAGSLRGTPDGLRWKTLDWSAMPRRELDTRPFAAGRAYPKEEIAWTEHQWEGHSDKHDPYVAFYEDFFAGLREGKPLAVSPQSVRRTIDVVNRAYAQTEHRFAASPLAKTPATDATAASEKPCTPA
ncbi:MAG: Gfo/Idh/MocA family oxidoreductase [Planctomycetota bacterium]